MCGELAHTRPNKAMLSLRPLSHHLRSSLRFTIYAKERGEGEHGAASGHGGSLPSARVHALTRVELRLVRGNLGGGCRCPPFGELCNPFGTPGVHMPLHTRHGGVR